MNLHSFKNYETSKQLVGWNSLLPITCRLLSCTAGCCIASHQEGLCTNFASSPQAWAGCLSVIKALPTVQKDFSIIFCSLTRKTFAYLCDFLTQHSVHVNPASHLLSAETAWGLCQTLDRMQNAQNNFYSNLV